MDDALQQRRNALCHQPNIGCRLKTSDDVPLAVNHELCEIPFDLRVVLVVGVKLWKDFPQLVRHLALAEPLKTFLRFQELVERERIFPVDLRFFHLRILRVVLRCAERVDLLVCPRRLPPKLVAGDVQDLKTLVAALLVNFLNSPVLSGKPSLLGRVDDKHHFAAAGIQRKIVSLPVFERVIIETHLVPSLCMIAPLGGAFLM